MSKKNITDPNYDTYKAFKNRLDEKKQHPCPQKHKKMPKKL